MPERRRRLARLLEETRQRTLTLVEALDADALEVQHDQLMSPLVWDLGHVAAFEELWLVRALRGDPRPAETLDARYDPFEQPRADRGELALPTREEALAELARVRARTIEVLEEVELAAGGPLVQGGFVWRMVAQHEAQHLETMLQSLQLLGLRRARPTAPPLVAEAPIRSPDARGVDDAARVRVPAGPFRMGTHDREAAYDNERPAHEVELGAFGLDRYPVTNRRYEEFVRDGGYEERAHWSARGWRWTRESGARAPLDWRGGDVLRFGARVARHPAAPVQHVSFHEAEAFARWAGARLPTEREWEKAARWDPDTGATRTYPWGEDAPAPGRANVDLAAGGPAPVGSLPGGASPCGAEQMLGDVHEWTASRFDPYPGFRAFPYPEYSEVFFGEEYRVLRGSSWAARPQLARSTYRNWDRPERRQLFAGFRLAWSA